MEIAVSEPCILWVKVAQQLPHWYHFVRKGVYRELSLRVHTCDTYWTKEIDQF